MIENCPHFVYALVDPFDTGNIRYIGQTNSLPGRLAQHRRFSRSLRREPLYAWWAGLTQEPVMRVLWQGAKAQANDIETRIIRGYRALGFELLNQGEGGAGNRGRCPTEDTRRKLSQSLRAVYANPEYKAGLKKPWTQERRKRQAEIARTRPRRNGKFGV